MVMMKFEKQYLADNMKSWRLTRTRADLGDESFFRVVSPLPHLNASKRPIVYGDTIVLVAEPGPVVVVSFDRGGRSAAQSTIRQLASLNVRALLTCLSSFLLISNGLRRVHLAAGRRGSRCVCVYVQQERR